MKTFSIKTKVILTLSILIIMLIVQSYVFNISQKTLQQLHRHQHQALIQTDNITNLENNILSLQNQATLYADNDNEYSIEKLHQYLDLAKINLNKIEKNALKSQANYISKLHQIHNYLSNYQDTFNQVVINKKQREALYQQQFKAPLDDLKNAIIKQQQSAPNETKSDFVEVILTITNIEQSTQSYLYNPRYDKAKSAELNLNHLQNKLTEMPELLESEQAILVKLKRIHNQLITITRGYTYSLKVVFTGIENELLYLTQSIKKIEQQKLTRSEAELTLRLAENTQQSRLFIFFSGALILLITFFMIYSVIRPINMLTNLLSDMANNKKVKFEHNYTLAGEIQTAISAANTLYLNNQQSNELLAETQQLNQKLQTTNIQLQHAFDEVELANKAKSDFTANMSHELRTPMNGVLGMLQLLNDSPLPANQRNYTEKALSSAQELLTTLNDILSFAKLESHQFQLEEQVFTLQSVIRQSQNLFQHQAEKKGISLAFICHANPEQEVIGDVSHLEKIIHNCISNAIKFTKAGGVEVIIEPHTQHENIISYTFRIKDSGIGIPSAQLNDIFKSFYQVDNTSTKNYAGTGLGLTISRQLTELLGGELKVKSQYGHGSEFYFTLSFTLASETKQPGQVLIITAQPNSVAHLCNTLSQAGLVSQVSHQPLRAVAMVCTNNSPFKTVIFHLSQQELQSNELLKQLQHYRQQQVHPFTLIAILTDADFPLTANQHQLTILGKNYSENELLQHIDCPKKSHENRHTPPRTFSGYTALVVDDNPINQEVLCAMLDKLQIRVVIAQNGQEAIDKSKNHTLDIVFMDIQMPLLDGLETTRILRNNNFKTPIIATTAAALSKDRKAAFAAGMNDFLAKPILFENFYQIIARHLDTEYTPQLLNISAALENVEQEQNALLCILEKFSREYKNFSHEINILFQTKQFTELERSVHTLKGLAGTLGLEQLAHHSRQLEINIKQQHNIDLSKLNQSLTLTLKVIAQYIKMAQNNSDIPSSQPPTSLLAILNQIYDLAMKSKPIPQSLVAQLTPFLNERNSALFTLKDAINNFNYQTIIEIISSYQNRYKDYEKPSK